MHRHTHVHRDMHLKGQGLLSQPSCGGCKRHVSCTRTHWVTWPTANRGGHALRAQTLAVRKGCKRAEGRRRKDEHCWQRRRDGALVQRRRIVHRCGGGGMGIDAEAEGWA